MIKQCNAAKSLFENYIASNKSKQSFEVDDEESQQYAEYVEYVMRKLLAEDSASTGEGTTNATASGAGRAAESSSSRRADESAHTSSTMGSSQRWYEQGASRCNVRPPVK